MSMLVRITVPLLASALVLGATAQPAARADGQEFAARYSFGGSADLDSAEPGAEVGVDSFQFAWRSSAARGENTRALFGVERTRHELDRTGGSWAGDWLEYREVRVGLAAGYAFAPAFGLRVEGRHAVDRRFEFMDRDLKLSGDGALYMGIGLTARF